MILRRSGMKFVTALKRGERVVSMISYKGQVLVATEYRIYRLQGNHLQPLIFEQPKC